MLAVVDPSLTRYCLVGIAVIASGVIYWALWRVVPKWFGYKFVPRKETLSDGTVVAVVCLFGLASFDGVTVELTLDPLASSQPKKWIDTTLSP